MEEDLCWDCGKKMEKKEVEYTLFNKSLGKFPALVCPKCKEPIFDEQTSDKISRIAKKKEFRPQKPKNI